MKRSWAGSAIAVASTAALVGAVPAAGASAPVPGLRLAVASPSVTIDSYGGSRVRLDLGAYLIAGDQPFEVQIKRKSYADPITAVQLDPGGSKHPLKGAVLTDFSGFRRFFYIRVTNSAGQQVVGRYQKFCPNGESSRTRPDAPGTSPYPEGCGGNPFTVGDTWGIQAGWGAPVNSWDTSSVKLAPGHYTATIGVAAAYRDMLGLPREVQQVKLTVRSGGEFAARSAHSAGRAPTPAAAAPTGPDSVPAGPRPDLRPAPAWGIQTTSGSSPRAGRNYLAFSATVWNAGPSPLVVDGFRRSGQDLMDAYQYFYDSAGNEVGHAGTGTMEWDPRPGHMHWHFTDFASYRLLNSSKKEVVRSQKEAFCLADTDVMDYTVPNANWHPYNTDLHTACGDHTALAVREVLDVGSGDTYEQYLPGQSFDLRGLPNGTYYIQVVANPRHRLYESDESNNISLRKVIIGGYRNHRTVTVPPYQLINRS
ncbi:MAG TPA: lysyl oxidase family protein [Mycobacteriales bacterium]|nr:lysyl oxidase family protein [Mycobacteriales bacterium]